MSGRRVRHLLKDAFGRFRWHCLAGLSSARLGTRQADNVPALRAFTFVVAQVVRHTEFRLAMRTNYLGHARPTRLVGSALLRDLPDLPIPDLDLEGLVAGLAISLQII